MATDADKAADMVDAVGADVLDEIAGRHAVAAAATSDTVLPEQRTELSHNY